MGKGDKRTRRGKISAGSFGKTRKKYKKPAFAASTEPKSATVPKEPKKRVAKRVPAPAAEVPAEAPVEEAPAVEATSQETSSTEEAPV